MSDRPCDARALCSFVARQQHEDPIGSVPKERRFLAVEVAPPWERRIERSKGFPIGLHEIVKPVRKRLLLRTLGLLPDPDYTEAGRTRVMWLSLPSGPAVGCDVLEYVVPPEDVVPLVAALLGDPDGLARFETDRRDTEKTRDFFICTHGRRDACCGKFGYPLYQTLRRDLAPRSPERLRVWRVSHFGGHEYAPTLIDFPEGRYWGHLDSDALEPLITRTGPGAALQRYYRGWLGLATPFEQAAERAIFALEGWAWRGYAKSGRIVTAGNPGDPVEVEIDFASPDGSRSGTYRALVALDQGAGAGSADGQSASAGQTQYRVTRLRQFEARSAATPA
ncbi:MAG TPA: sucrase ferredoxin [Dehalococcoidia bacterium]|nr:sucrase ferredoxin [Dehalococcoidia bacterium]